MKVILITIALVCAYAACMVSMPGVTHAFDKRWECPLLGKGAVVCVRKR
ncbi:MAG: hypothetical protein J0H42_33320 [Rhizobiales bacterium]|nr:hypothetical protein [Hyphomicrobiales bacterium]